MFLLMVALVVAAVVTHFFGGCFFSSPFFSSNHSFYSLVQWLSSHQNSSSCTNVYIGGVRVATCRGWGRGTQKMPKWKVIIRRNQYPVCLWGRTCNFCVDSIWGYIWRRRSGEVCGGCGKAGKSGESKKKKSLKSKRWERN